MSKSAKEHFEAIARLVYVQAVDAHVLGISLSKRSACLAQLGRIATESEVSQALGALIDDGFVAMGADGEYALAGDVAQVSHKLTNTNVGMG